MLHEMALWVKILKIYPKMALKVHHFKIYNLTILGVALYKMQIEVSILLYKLL